MYKTFKVRRVAIVVLLGAAAIVLINFQSIMRHIYRVNFSEDIYRYAEQYQVNPYLVMGIIKAESSYNVHAVSHKNAKGLMQITDDTAWWLADQMGLDNFDVSDYKNPEINIQMGCFYVRYLMDLFAHEEKVALAAYNAGPNTVKHWLDNKKYSSDGVTLDYIPYRETERYINKVLNYEDVYKRLYSKHQKA